MGSVRLPCWKVAGPVGLSVALVGSMVHIDVPCRFGGVQQALVYSILDYMSARGAWCNSRPAKGSGKGSSPPLALKPLVAGPGGGG